jgi:hypothetical protein
VAVVATAASKAEAVAKCREMNPHANLVTVKSQFQQYKLEQYFAGKNYSGVSIFDYNVFCVAFLFLIFLL